MNSYYVPSGKYSPTSFFLLLVLCFTAFPLLGGLYTYAIWFIPFIYVNFLITAVFAFSVGFLMKKIVFGFGKVRNVRLGIVLAFLGGCVALYAHWVVWADLILNSTEVMGTRRIGIVKTSTNLDNLIPIATQPKLIFQLMTEVSEYGTWGIFGMTVSGAMLWIVWVLEALTILTGSIMIGIGQTKEPFCERSDKWFNQRAMPPTSYIVSKEDLVSELELGKDHILASLHLHDVVFDNASYSQFTVYSSDQDEHYLSAQNMKKRMGSNGEVEYEEDPIIGLISISSKTLKLLEGAKRASKVEEITSEA